MSGGGRIGIMSLALPCPRSDVTSASVEPIRPVARKATLDDLPALHALWQRAGLPWSELERFVTEFQVVPGDDGLLQGAVGLQIDGSEALLHSEAIFPGTDADEIRAASWTRMQIVARNQGVARLWTLEDAPFWKATFVRADPAAVQGLQAAFRDPEADWLVFQLVDPVRAQKLVDERLALWEANRHADSDELLNKINLIRTLAFTAAGLLIGAMLLMVVFVLVKRPDLLQRLMGR